MKKENNIISFILCVNNEELYNNAREFINGLIVPEGYKIEIVKIQGAKSITSGYNDGMRRAKGRIKIYLHQDVYLINPFLIRDIIKIFADRTIGLIGVAGAKQIPESFIWWEAPITLGVTYEIRDSHMYKLQFQMPKQPYEIVMLLDGLLLITQYDIPWREDILDGWHFYDISQCLEFKKKQLKVVIPYQKRPWTIHDCGQVSTEKYEWYRNIIKKEYS